VLLQFLSPATGLLAFSIWAGSFAAAHGVLNRRLPGRDPVLLPVMALLKELGRRGVNEVHAEAGFKLNGSLVREGCVDELLVYMAPMLIGDATGMVNLPALSDLAQAQRLQFREVTQVGEDVRILARWGLG
jgi:riboflavin biosynthesis pyrimidine reductase